jgi:ketosteroid isomerase-like protein
MRNRVLAILAILAFLAGCAPVPQKPDHDALRKEVLDTERAFAATMAKRDFAAFESFLSEEAVFFSGPKPLRGKAAISEGWKKFYEKPDPPFSWEPGDVQVLDSGTLALSTGPVKDPSGATVATFSSIWRLEAPGRWRIIFDKGCDLCDSPRP